MFHPYGFVSVLRLLTLDAHAKPLPETAPFAAGVVDSIFGRKTIHEER